MHADLYRVASSVFSVGPFLPSDTNLSCQSSRGVLTVLMFALHPESLMLRGAHVRFNVQELSSLICPDSEHTFNNRRLFVSDSPNQGVPMSFVVSFFFEK